MITNQLTIVIPTYNRHKYLNRILSYYKNFQFNNILVIDSTIEEFDNKDEYNIEYFHYPNISFSEKMLDAINKVKTEYMVVCADDDFILLDASLKCVEFLDNNPEYVSCSGTFVTFYTEYLENYNFLSLDVNEFKEYSNKNLLDRIDFHFNNYYTLMYSIHRTKVFKNFIDDFIDINQPFLREVGQSFYTLAQGGNKVLPFFYGARECMKGESEGQTNDNLEVVSSNKKYEDEYNLFYSKILNILKKYNGENNFIHIVDKAISDYKEQCIVSKPNPSKIFLKKIFSFFDYMKKKHTYKHKSLLNLESFTSAEGNLNQWLIIEKIIKKYK
ncbi:TIGR00180 family glycosyltransferase [Sulfurimonas sp.]|uniref:TIGR00180 family glycosyltransferase n=1 Tax=Sulfurimonas sp. TaxID=2022749 RepID=UPI003564A170